MEAVADTVGGDVAAKLIWKSKAGRFPLADSHMLPESAAARIRQ